MPEIEAWLDDLRQVRGDLFPIVARLRALVLATGPAIREEIKYGGILFASSAGFCGIFVYQAHVTLEFGEGSKLADPFGVLAGKGKHRRHIRLESEGDIAAKHVDDYLREARRSVDHPAL